MVIELPGPRRWSAGARWCEERSVGPSDRRVRIAVSHSKGAFRLGFTEDLGPSLNFWAKRYHECRVWVRKSRGKTSVNRLFDVWLYVVERKRTVA